MSTCSFAPSFQPDLQASIPSRVRKLDKTTSSPPPMSFFTRLRAPLFENTGSTARDHLASERTFLAWMRTGLGFIALGVAVERFSQLELSEALPRPQPLSQAEQERRQDQEQMLVGALLGTGSGAIVYGITRYFSNMRLLERGQFRPAYFGAGALGTAVAAFAGAAYWGTIRDELARRRLRREGKRGDSTGA